MCGSDAGDLDAAVAGYTEGVEHDAVGVVGAPSGPLRGPAARQRYEQLLRDVRTEQLVEVRRFYAEDVRDPVIPGGGVRIVW